MTTDIPVPQSTPKRFDWLHVSLIAVLAIIVAVIATNWVIRTYLFPTQFTPVTLSEKETQVLDRKLEQLDWSDAGQHGKRSRTQGKADKPALPPLNPEAYSEAGASREVFFTEKELNAMVAKNTDLARKLAIDLSENLVSAKLLVPLDEDFPMLGGKTLKVRAGLELAYQQGRPVVVLKGVSIMGVPLPNAWLGGIKNIDLVKEFGNDRGFWKSFADGVDYIQVQEGLLKIKLKE
jgi:hypothetical protein